MSNQPLISIGVPAYNRPDGLRKTLFHIARQTYANLDIIVSDNCSPDPEVARIVEEFSSQDHRIRSIRQTENIGASKNFMCVLEKARGDFFMWAADDDYLESTDLVERLARECQTHALVFPDINLCTGLTKIDYCVLARVYKDCATPWDYLNAWSRNLSGYPVYGLFNLKLLRQKDIALEFDTELIYYNEGTLLHKIFMTCPVKFMPGVYIRVDNNSQRPDSLVLMSHFLQFFRKMFVLEIGAHTERKLRILRNFFVCGRANLENLFRQSWQDHGGVKSLKMVIFRPVLVPFLASLPRIYLKRKLRRLRKNLVRAAFIKPLKARGFTVYSKDELRLRDDDKRQQEAVKHLWLADFKIQTILDIGANTGQFAASISKIFPDANLYCFEPIRACFEALQSNLSNHDRVKIFNMALGNENGEQIIHLNEYSPSSSILEMSGLHKQAFPFTEHSTTEKIHIKRLDDVGEVVLEGPLFVKIDVQGFENEVIKGGLKTIAQADIILVETTFEELYKGQPLFHEIYLLLNELGFEFRGNYEQLTNPNDGRILQADSIFVKIHH